ncbi:MAG: chorismate synthase, partial [Actinobacteria bacterium]
RSSARETTARVAVAGVAKRLLSEFGITILSHVTEIGGVRIGAPEVPWEELRRRAEASEVRCADPEAERRMIEAIDQAKAAGDTLGGVFEVVALGCPVGLGSYVQWDRKLDGRLARAFCSIHAIKGAEIGLGFEAARRPGSQVHHEILFDGDSGFHRESNSAGGLEGGVTNGTVSTTVRKVPLLGDIPIFGWLFKQKENNETGRELVVFVTPSILQGQGGAGLALTPIAPR